MVYKGLAGYPPPTQLAVCQLRHRQDLSLSALCALCCPDTVSALLGSLIELSFLNLILCFFVLYAHAA